VNHPRRTAAALAVLLGTATLPALAAAPAGAAPGCLQDVPVTILTSGGCDDTTAPETSFGATAPRINAAGWINKTTIRVGITGHHTDGDTDPLTLQCHLSLEPGVPAEADWTTCPENGVFANLQQTASKPYVLWARAVDAGDQAVAWSDGVPFNGTDETAPDLDESPARLEFRVDSLVPDSYIFGTPYDPLTPQLPMVTDPDVPLRLAATELSSFTCLLDAVAVPCSSGATRLRGVGPGNHTLTVQAVDAAGNLDPSPATTRFAVPLNLTIPKRAGKKTAGWKRVANGGFLGGDYLVASRKGTEMTLKAGGFHEVRLLATTGPHAGTLEIKVGEGWHRVSLKRRTETKRDQIQVFDEFAPRRGGKVVIRLASQGKRVQLDGILLR
jgi:hypothetical protein